MEPDPVGGHLVDERVTYSQEILKEHGWITEATAPSRFTFETSTIWGDRSERTNRWRYDIEPHPDGTLVVETLQTLRLPIHLKLLGPLLGLRWLQIKSGMARTLDRLAHECERASED